jgi:hypothetical protein
MIHPLFRLAAARPLLLVDHAGAYASLSAEALGIATARFKRGLIWQLAGLAGLVVAAVLAGVAVLLWAVVPQGSMPMAGLLWLVPAVPALLGLWALWLGQDQRVGAAFATLRVQLQEDATLLRSAFKP